jgi:8-oxo-dGTP pyrophosphatase MutT (NUDIX family)
MNNVIWVNEQDEILGEIPMDQAHKEGQLHRVSAIYLTNNTGEILIQERTDWGLDHSSAGHVDPGESYLEAAQRELEEELGVTGVELKEIGKIASDEPMPDEHEHARHQFMVFECKANPGELAKDEIKSVFWENPLEIWKDMQKRRQKKKYRKGFEVTLELFLKSKSLI